jgi:hypothetical protein
LSSFTEPRRLNTRNSEKYILSQMTKASFEKEERHKKKKTQATVG